MHKFFTKLEKPSFRSTLGLFLSKNFKKNPSQKNSSKLILNLYATAGAQPESFQGRGGFVKLGYSDKHFVKNSSKKGPTG